MSSAIKEKPVLTLPRLAVTIAIHIGYCICVLFGHSKKGHIIHNWPNGGGPALVCSRCFRVYGR